MLFKRINAQEPERVFTIVENSDTAVLPKDSTCGFDTGAVLDGMKARSLAAGMQLTFLGVVDQAIPVGQLGLVQIYGFRSSSLMVRGAVLNPGTPLAPVAGAPHLIQVETSVASTLPSIWAVALESLASSSSGSASPRVFLRAM